MESLPHRAPPPASAPLRAVRRDAHAGLDRALRLLQPDAEVCGGGGLLAREASPCTFPQG
eukprot:15436050-Alexandrium_andersonii.AAC.1